MIGHVFPVWLGFRGGKGVATGAGVLLAAAWWLGLVCALIWLVMAKVTRISSASALTACFAAPIIAWLSGDNQLAIFALALALLIAWRHQANIRRLLAGTEPRIGQKS
jgi:glycerol-3-phosphate acyltransferase PlsY